MCSPRTKNTHQKSQVRLSPYSRSYRNSNFHHYPLRELTYESSVSELPLSKSKWASCLVSPRISAYGDTAAWPHEGTEEANQYISCQKPLAAWNPVLDPLCGHLNHVAFLDLALLYPAFCCACVCFSANRRVSTGAEVRRVCRFWLDNVLGPLNWDRSSLLTHRFFPGFRHLLSPSAMLANAIPWFIPGVCFGRSYAWRTKHGGWLKICALIAPWLDSSADFDIYGSDIYTIVRPQDLHC